MNAAAFADVNAAFPWFFPAVAFLFGACVGSFLNVVIYRLPKDESVVTPGSHCACGVPIKWYDNIPILSWLLLRGRARCCGRHFSARYPAIELLTAVLFTVCWRHYGAHPAVAACGALFVACLIAATFIDLDHFIIPEIFTLWLGVAGVVLSFAVPELHGQHHSLFAVASLRSGLMGLTGLLIGSAIVLWILVLAEAILKKEGMGFGDVLFVGAIGAFCGWEGAIFTLFGGAGVGTCWAAAAWIWEKISGKTAPIAPPTETPEGEPTALGIGAHMPFGPSLAVAGGCYFLFPHEWVTDWFAQVSALF